MRLTLFRNNRSINEAIDITLEQVSSALTTGYNRLGGLSGPTEAQIFIHHVTNAHLAAIYDAIGGALGKDVPEPKDETPVPFRVERKDDGLWLRAEGYNGRQAAIRLSDSHGPIVTAAIEEAMAREKESR